VDFGLAEHFGEQKGLGTMGKDNSPAPAAGAGELSPDIRQIISGIAVHFPDPAVLVGKNCMFVTNLLPRIIRGLQSAGMILTVSTEDGKFSLLEPANGIPPGAKAK
jgi:tRNA-binding EMAP/Myf-like protein